MLSINGFDITADYIRSRAHKEAEIHRQFHEAGVRTSWDRARDRLADTLIGGGEFLQRFGCRISCACAKSPEPATTSISVECS